MPGDGTLRPAGGVATEDLEATIADWAARKALADAGYTATELEGVDATALAMNEQLIANKIKPAGGTILPFCNGSGP